MEHHRVEGGSQAYTVEESGQKRVRDEKGRSYFAWGRRFLGARNDWADEGIIIQNYLRDPFGIPLLVVVRNIARHIGSYRDGSLSQHGPYLPVRISQPPPPEPEQESPNDCEISTI